MSAIQRLHKVKIEWSSPFAYAIGLIASDGNLSHDGRHIGIISAELEAVENFKKALGVNNRVGRSARGGESIKKYFYTQVGDIVFYEFLNSIGLTRAKSKTIKAVAVPDEFFADFVRGLFDGDGTFYSFWDKRWPNSFGFQMAFASASPVFINWFKENLTRLYGVKGCFHNGDGVLNLRYMKGDSVKLFNVMYYKKDLIFLERKYRNILNIIERDPNLKWKSIIATMNPHAGLAQR